ncbi:hypothetical protein ACNKHK_17460 [Shigella flexneri]
MLCLGADLKNTFCLVVAGSGYQPASTQLQDDGIQQQWRNALRLIQIFMILRHSVVHNAPGYVSSQWASEMNLPTKTVLHHHAHAAACLASTAGRSMAAM